MSSTIEREFVAGLEKGLMIIEAFALKNGPLTVSEAAKITGHSRASARRSLLTLEQLGYVDTDGRYFRPAPRLLRLAHAYVAASPLAKLVQPSLEALSERTQEPCSFAVLDGGDVVFVARATARRSLSGGLWIGSRLPAYCAATGRVLLAALPAEDALQRLQRMARQKLTPHTLTEIPELMDELASVRAHGYALSSEEIELGVRSIAVPIRNGAGETMASVSIASAVSRRSADYMVNTLLPELESVRRMLRSLL